ncbi:MAG: DUF1349 domain-containing protein, partial [Firmicutes bacterium]|nr:DUF1349 domain-containing protein [Bacillota bacterium]
GKTVIIRYTAVTLTLESNMAGNPVIKGATVTVTQDGSITVTDNNDGTYTFTLVQGALAQVAITATGFKNDSFNISGGSLNASTYADMVTMTCVTKVTAEYDINNATVTAAQGATSLTVANLNNGKYEFIIEAGAADVVVTAKGTNTITSVKTITAASQSAAPIDLAKVNLTSTAFNNSVWNKGDIDYGNGSGIKTSYNVTADTFTISDFLPQNPYGNIWNCSMAKSISGKNWEITVKMALTNLPGSFTSGSAPHAGMFFGSSSDKYEAKDFFGWRGDWGGHVGSWDDRGPGGYISGAQGGSAGCSDPLSVYLRLKRVGDNIYTYYSADGVNFSLIASFTVVGAYADEDMVLHLGGRSYSETFPVTFSEYSEVHYS